MRKYLIVVLLLNLMTVSPAIADVTTGACWDPYGYAHRAGNHISNTCLIMKNGGCIACGINNYNGCSGGCSGEGVGNPGYQPEGSIVGAFKCLASGEWLPVEQFTCEGSTNPDPDPKPDPDPDPDPDLDPDPTIRCGTGYYVKVNASRESVCVRCPSAGDTQPDTDYGVLDPYDFIRSDGQNLNTCALSSIDMPYWQDASGKFELLNMCYYVP